jgi:F-type H+-transporting ATPase subunit alpha
MPDSQDQDQQRSLEDLRGFGEEQFAELRRESAEMLDHLKEKFTLQRDAESPIKLMIESIEASAEEFHNQADTMSISQNPQQPHSIEDLRSITDDQIAELKRESAEMLDQLKEKFTPKRSAESPIRLMINSVDAAVDQFESRVDFEDIGTVLHVGDGVATLSGLPSVHTEEMVTFPTGVGGLVFSLDPHRLDVILLGSDEGIRGGDLVRTSGKRLRIPVGPNLLGRVVNPLGDPLDGGQTPKPSDFRLLERDAPGIISRQPIYQPLQTGWKVIDALVPIGRGQRELIVGDRQTGKTTIAVDAILQQRDANVACIYVAIGQKKSSTLNVINRLREHGALEYTTVVMSTPDDPPALRYLAPYAGCTLAEYLMDHERDVLIVYDDLTKHANAYRELSLLLRRPPGREAYPGDVFYLHSRLLERAGKLNEEFGSGSMTALPIIETQRGNLAAYIPTNLISITDGQIVLDTELFNQDVKPAVDVGLSVSRVGGSAQTKAMKKVAGELRLQLSQYEEVARFARLGTEVDEATQQQIERGSRLRQMLTQSPHQPLSLAEQVVILFATQQGALETIAVENVSQFERELLAFINERNSELLEEIELKQDLGDEMAERLRGAINTFLNSWNEERSAAG